MSTITKINEFNHFLNNIKAERDHYLEKDRLIKNKINNSTNKIKDLKYARDMMSTIGVTCQLEIKTIIEELVCQVLKPVFGDEYGFELENKTSRNKPESYFYILVNGKRRSPRDDDIGGGASLLVSFCLRVILWAITKEKTDNVLCYDEPLKDVDKDKLLICGDMFKQLATMLNIQFIVVTHEGEIIDCADKGYYITKTNEISAINEVDNE